jgi:hypothetical protein
MGHVFKKEIMLRILQFVVLLSSFSLLGQSGAGVYKVKWLVDKRLTNRFIVENTPIGTQGTGRLEIPANLYDSVIADILTIVKDELHTDAALLYPLNNNGDQMRTVSSTEWVGGLPRGTKKRAMRTEYKEYYVKFKIRVGVYKTLSIGNELASYNRLRPFVRVKMKAYGLDRRVKFRKRIRKGGFNSIGSFEYNVGGISMTNSNALPIEEVVNMVFQGLQRFKDKVK